MKLSETYPAMSEAHRKLVMNSLVASFEYILSAGEDEACQLILDEQMDLSVFEHVAKRVEEYRRDCEDAKLRAGLEGRAAKGRIP
jgi:hypothetical protein